MPARPANQHAQSATLAQPVARSRAEELASFAATSHHAASAHADVEVGAAPAHHGHKHAHGRGHAHGHAHTLQREARSGQPNDDARLAAGGTRAERAATWLSLACAVHCLLMPIAISVMPLVGASGFANVGPAAETALTLMVVGSALAGGVWGYRRHRDLRVVYATGVGLAAYLVGHAPGHAFGEALAHSWYGMALAILGALTLAGSSFLSARLSHACSSAACSH